VVLHINSARFKFCPSHKRLTINTRCICDCIGGTTKFLFFLLTNGMRKIKIYVILSPEKKAGFHSMTGRLLPACRRGEPGRNTRLGLKGGDRSYQATG
jgi:hypothetical protein